MGLAISPSKQDSHLSSKESMIGGLAERYAVALFELMQELPADGQQQLHDDVATLLVLLSENADLQKLIRSPIISADEQTAALDAVLKKAGGSQLLRNFVSLVISKRRTSALPDMARQYAILVAGSRDEMVAYITSAHALADGQIEDLKRQLKDVFGKTIVVDAKQDSALLGGLIVEIGSQMIDGSLRTKLNTLKTALNG